VKNSNYKVKCYSSSFSQKAVNLLASKKNNLPWFTRPWFVSSVYWRKPKKKKRNSSWGRHSGICSLAWRLTTLRRWTLKKPTKYAWNTTSLSMCMMINLCYRLGKTNITIFQLFWCKEWAKISTHIFSVVNIFFY